jgi:hypothetical protein
MSTRSLKGFSFIPHSSNALMWVFYVPARDAARVRREENTPGTRLVVLGQK